MRQISKLTPRGISQQTNIKLHSSGDGEGREGVLYNLRLLMQVDKSLKADRKCKSPVCVGPSERAPWRPATAPTSGHAPPWGDRSAPDHRLGQCHTAPAGVGHAPQDGVGEAYQG